MKYISRPLTCITQRYAIGMEQTASRQQPSIFAEASKTNSLLKTVTTKLSEDHNINFTLISYGLLQMMSSETENKTQHISKKISHQ